MKNKRRIRTNSVNVNKSQIESRSNVNIDRIVCSGPPVLSLYEQFNVFGFLTPTAV